MRGNPNFSKGMSKIQGSGRQKGSVNKKKLKKVSDVLAESDLDPVKQIVSILQSGELKPRDEADVWLQLLSYCQAKPKESDGADSEFNPEDFDEVATADLLKLVKAQTGE